MDDEGVADKPDYCCAAPGCSEQVDFRKHDKPPPGWANVTITRWGKKGFRRQEVLVCKRHTVSVIARQVEMFE